MSVLLRRGRLPRCPKGWCRKTPPAMRRTGARFCCAAIGLRIARRAVPCCSFMAAASSSGRLTATRLSRRVWRRVLGVGGEDGGGAALEDALLVTRGALDGRLPFGPLARPLTLAGDSAGGMLAAAVATALRDAACGGIDGI